MPNRRKSLWTISQVERAIGSTIFPVALGAALHQQLLHDGFLAGLLLEDAAEAADIFAGDGLEDDAVAFFHEIDPRAGLDAKPAADARGNDQLAFGCDVGGIHIASGILKKG